MAHLITLDEHPDTVALVLTLEEAAFVKVLVGQVAATHTTVGNVWAALEYHNEIVQLYEYLIKDFTTVSGEDVPTLTFRKST